MRTVLHILHTMTIGLVSLAWALPAAAIIMVCSRMPNGNGRREDVKL